MGELLVYETFLHNEKDDLKLNLIKFLSPVHLRELRVIPEGMPPHVELANALGATSPSSFELLVYCNDSNNPLAPAFEELGKLKYESDNFVLPLKTKSPTDTVLVRGHYNALSLCVYGYKASSSLGHSHGYLEPSRRKKRPMSPLSDGGIGGSDGEGIHSPSRKKKRKLEDEASSKKDSFDQKSAAEQGYEDLFEDFSPDHSPSFDYFDDIGGSLPKKAAMGYEEFSDEEIAFGDDDFDGQEGKVSNLV